MSGIRIADRVRNLPPYLFAQMDQQKGELRARGVDIIDLSIGDPDLPTPVPIIEALSKGARDAQNHRYPPYSGTLHFREAVAKFYMERFNVSLDPKDEILLLIGSKEGIAHTPLAFLNPGDVALIPDPGYPVYGAATLFAGGRPYLMPLLKEKGFHPDLTMIPSDILKKARLLFLNYPNNPTSAIATRMEMEKYVAFCNEHDLLFAHDAAYTEVMLGGVEPLSALQVPSGKECSLEFHSLSKTFNMTGWRVGFAVGNREAVAGLGKIKTNMDSSQFGAIQEAGILALSRWKEFRDQNNAIYERRRDLVTQGLKAQGISFFPPKATFYVWCEVPKSKMSSTEYCLHVMKEVGVQFTPGVGFGSAGEGYFRISLTASEVRLQEMLERLKKMD